MVSALAPTRHANHVHVPTRVASEFAQPGAPKAPWFQALPSPSRSQAERPLRTDTRTNNRNYQISAIYDHGSYAISTCFQAAFTEVPRRVVFKPELTKHPTGKILRRDLRKQGEIERGIDFKEIDQG